MRRNFSKSSSRPRSARADRRQRSLFARPGLEPLEERVVLTIIPVTSLDDSGPGTLRDAVDQANTNPGDDEIVFDGGLAGTIALTSGELYLTDTTGLTRIIGPGAGTIAVDGGGSSRLFSVDFGVTAELSGLTLSNGSAFTGAAVDNSGTLAITGSVISGNWATRGGAVHNSGALAITGSVISGNWAFSTGGAIYNVGALELRSSTVTGNSVFGLNSYSPYSNTLFGYGGNGGGLYNSGTAVVVDSTISDNLATVPGPVAPSGEDVSINGGMGGGVYNRGTLTLLNSTVSGNTARLEAGSSTTGYIGSSGGMGGGIANLYGGDLTLINSTVSGNLAWITGGSSDSGSVFTNGGGGGGIDTRTGSARLISSTVTGNFTSFSPGGSNSGSVSSYGGVGGGVRSNSPYTYASPALILSNTIVAGNGDSTGLGPDVGGFVAGQRSLIGIPGSAIVLGGDNLFFVDPQLGPLADNGGPTLTHAPAATGPAVDAGDPSLLPPDAFDLNGDGDPAELLPVDQRGLARLNGVGLDIGAVELNLFDGTAPRVVSSSVQQGDVLPSGALTVTIGFDEQIDAGGLGGDDFALVGAAAGAHAASAIVYDPATRSLTLTFDALGDDDYTLTLFSGDGRIEDPSGNDLDGEPVAFPLPPNRSGDGTPGGNFVVGFSLTEAPPPPLGPLSALTPAGGLIYEGVASSGFGAVGDVDALPIALDAGQVATVVVTVGPAVRARVALKGPGGQTLATASSATAGQPAVLQAVPIGAGGSYTVEVESLEGVGAYQVRLLLNARAEAEPLFGADNGTAAGAEPFGTAAVPLGVGADHRAVVGTVASAGDADTFALTLLAGQPATILATAIGGGAVEVELLDAGGVRLTRGLAGSANVGRRIDRFVAPADGTYLVRVTGAAGASYSLVVLRQAEFDAEPNDSPATAPDRSGATRFLGSLAGLGVALQADFAGPGGVLSLDGFQATGLWHVTSTAPGAALPGHSSPQLAYYGNSATGNFDNGARNSGTLTSTPIALPSGLGGLLSFNYRLQGEGGNPYDRADVQVSTDGGSTWVTIASNSGSPADLPETLTWSPFTVSLADFAGQTVRLRFAFDTIDGIANDGLGWQIDDVVVIGPDTVDAYAIGANPGDVLTITTATPGDGPGEPGNVLDPRIELYNPAGVLVASDDDGGGDGRNAALSYTVPVGSAGGLYRVIIRAQGSAGGEYVLSVDGATGAAPAFTASALSPPDGALLGAFPSTYRVRLSSAVLETSVDAADLTIDGVAAASVTIIDPTTLEFSIAGADAGDGLYQAEIAAGALTSVSGAPLSAFASTFDTDTTSPRVVDSSIAAGDVLAPGPLVVAVRFSEELAAAGLGPEDVALVEAIGGASVAISGFSYDPATSTATITLPALVEGNYTLTLLTSADAFRDRRGNLLDGAPSFPLPSGDGTPGDPFVLPFAVDVATAPVPVPLSAAAPRGGLVFEGRTTGAGNAAGDEDRFTVDLEAGPRVAVALSPTDPALRARLELIGPGGAVVASAEAASAGQRVLLTAEAAAAGTYEVRVTTLDGPGRYAVDLLLDALIEAEPNDDAATAQDLGGSSVPLPQGADRLAVVGRTEAGGDDVYRVSLAPGQAATVALANLAGGAVGRLELRDPSGTLIALGDPGPGGQGIGLVIPGVVAAVGGDYTLRVSGPSGVRYSLVVTRGAAFDLEPNDTTGTAQPIGPTPVALGSVADGIRAVEPDQFPDGTVLTTAFPGVTLSAVNGSGPVQSTTGPASTGSRIFSHGGSTVWNSSSNWLRADFASPVSEVSIDVIGDDNEDPGILEAYNAAGVLVAQFITPTSGPAGVPRTMTIARPQSDIAFIRAAGQGGDTAYLDNLRYRGDSADVYRFDAPGGAVVELRTTTPGGAPGEPTNAFNPRLLVFDAGGLLVAVDEDSGDDGRNARIVLPVPSGGGTYFAWVESQDGTAGEYTLSILGAAPTAGPAPSVVLSDPADGRRLPGPPSTVTLTFSEPLRLDTVDAGDLVIDGGAAVTGVEVVDARTIRFAVAVPDAEGTYTVSLAAGAVADLQGTGASSYSGTFLIDKTGPRVASQAPQLQASAPFGSLTFVFDEPIDPSTFTTADVVSFVGPGGTDLRGQITGVSGSGTTYTVTFTGRTAAGAYTMVIGPDIRDVAGNRMDQDGDGQAGEAGDDAYTATIDLESPDLTVTAVGVPAGAVFGQQVTVTWTVRNAGTDPARESWSDRVYLSTDTTFDFSDTLLLTQPVGGDSPLAAGASYDRTASVTLPLSASLAAGTYYILVRADALGQQPEDSEANNVLAGAALPITLPPLPDLVVADIQAPIDAFAGQQIPITWTLTNQGDGPATGTWSDDVYLSGDAAAGGDQFFGRFSFTGTLAPGQSIQRTQLISLPQNLQGDRWVVVRTDVFGQVFEHDDEGNNATVDDRPIAVQIPPLPNLRVSSVAAPPSAFSGQSTVIEWVVTNAGTGATSAPLWRDAVYLSTDQTLDGSDVFLGTADNPSFLGAGDSYVNELTVTLPRGIDGNYYVLVVADSNNNVFEFEAEGDNLGVGGPTDVNLTPPPDLQVTNVNAPAIGFSGQPVSLSWTVRNQGTGETQEAAWYDQVFLSADTTLDGSDVSLGHFFRSGALAVDGSYTGTLTATLPVGISGNYSFIVRTDTFDQVFEFAAEGNNTNFDATPTDVRLTPPPDLETSLVAAPASARAGTGLTIGYRVTNFGSTPTPNGSWTDRFYLSADTTLDAGDLLLGSRTHFGALDIGSFYDATATFTLPNGLAGPFYAIVVADADNAVFELDNANNAAFDAGLVSVVSQPADLRVASVAGPAAGTSGEAVRVEWTVTNAGAGDTIRTSWRDRVYLSADAVFDANDRQLAEFIHAQQTPAGAAAPLGVGQSYSRSELVTLPVDAAGAAFLFVVTDATGLVFEGADEGNNASAARPIAIASQTPDLVVVDVSAPSTAQSGGTLTVEWIVRNFGVGGTAAAFWRDAVYLSPDPLLGGGNDLFLGEVTRNGALAGQGEYTASRTFTLPIDLSGPYYVLVATDSGNQVFEATAENNNVNASASAVAVALSPVPDLVVSGVDAPIGVVSGQQFAVSWTVTNQGAGTGLGFWDDAVFLSRDQIFDPGSDTYVGFRRRDGGLGAGQSYTQTEQTFTVPRGLSGPFYVFVATDSGGRVYERLGESNNAGYDSQSMAVTLAPPADLVVGTFTVPANALVGQTATIGVTITNQGDDAAIGRWFDSIYISADDTFDIGDRLFARVERVGDVPAGGSYAVTATATMPPLPPGSYRVIVRTDIRNNIPEVDESNNVAASLDQVVLDVEPLPLNVPDTGTLAAGQFAYYRIDNVPAGETLLIDLASTNGSASNELYVRFGDLPTRGQFDFAFTSPFAADQRVVVPVTRAGTYYVLAYGDRVPGGQSYTIESDILEFTVLDASFGRGGTAGNRTIEVNGAKFDRTVTAALRDASGNELPAVAYFFENQSRFYPTFDLRSATPGLYDVVVRRGDGAEVVVADGLEVVFGGGGTNRPSISAPNAVRRNVAYTFSVAWANIGINDAPAPLLYVGNTAPFGLQPGSASLGTQYSFMGTNTEGGPAGILRPGQSESINFFGFSGADPGTYHVIADRRYSNLEAAFDFDALVPLLRPPGMTPAEFAPIFEQFRAQVGPTQGDYLAMLARNATLLTPVLGDRRSEADLVALELRKATAAAGTSISGRAFAASFEVEIAGIEVRAENTTTQQQYLTYTLTDGSFIFEDLDPGEYTFYIPGAVLDAPAVSLSEGEALAGLTLTLAPTADLTGQVTRLGGGTVVAGADVSLLDDDGRILVMATTDAGGSYRLAAVSPGAYTLVVNAAGLARTAQGVVIAGADDQVANVALPGESTVRGSVSGPSGEEVELYSVLAVRGDGEGVSSVFAGNFDQAAFALGTLPPGVYDIMVAAPGLTPATFEDVAIAAATDLDLGQITLGGLGASVFIDPLDALETGLKAGVLGNILLRGLGFDAYRIASRFFDSSSPNSTVGISGGSFRDNTVTKDAIRDILGMIAAEIPNLPQVREAVEQFDNCDDEPLQLEFDIEQLVNELGLPEHLLFVQGRPDDNDHLDPPDLRASKERWKYRGVDNAPGLLAGGVGRGGPPPFFSIFPPSLGVPTILDSRRVSGQVTVNISPSGQAYIEAAGLNVEIKDTFDFWPGGFGDSFLVAAVVTGMRTLELFNRAYDVPFETQFTANREKVDFTVETPSSDECCPDEDCDDEEDIDRPIAVDPNDILGPEGFGPERWVAAGQPLGYTIRFENDPVLGLAPAQVVRITQTLDPDLDPRTFRVGDFGFGSVFVDVPDNRAFHSERLDLRESLGIFVDVVAGIDVATGEAFWEFTSVDPATGDPPIDALLGFLPPNADGQEGQGFVSYTARPRASAATGTVIDAEASIVFDINAPIDTPPIFNTLDADPPESTLTAPATDEDGTFLVSWSGDDPAGAGLAGFTVYVSVDGGPFAAWLEDVTITEAEYLGEPGHTYAFYVVARDNAGNVEAAPGAADATVVVASAADRPTVTAVVVQAGMDQRSYVDQYSWTFDEPVNLAALIADGTITQAATLANYGVAGGTTGTPVALAAAQFSYDAATNTLTWRLAPASAKQSLPDGFYRWSLDTSRILGEDGGQLEGTDGGAFFVSAFHRLEGDANGDRSVGTADVDLYKAAAGSRPGLANWDPDVDLDRDGRITIKDYQIIQRNQGNTVILPALGGGGGGGSLMGGFAAGSGAGTGIEAGADLGVTPAAASPNRPPTTPGAAPAPTGSPGQAPAASAGLGAPTASGGPIAPTAPAPAQATPTPTPTPIAPLGTPTAASMGDRPPTAADGGLAQAVVPGSGPISAVSAPQGQPEVVERGASAPYGSPRGIPAQPANPAVSPGPAAADPSESFRVVTSIATGTGGVPTSTDADRGDRFVRSAALSSAAGPRPTLAASLRKALAPINRDGRPAIAAESLRAARARQHLAVEVATPSHAGPADDGTAASPVRAKKVREVVSRYLDGLAADGSPGGA